MFIGHYAPAFVAATSPKSPRLGALFVAAQLVDIAFFSFLILGVEHMRLVPHATVMNPMDLYDMPWTHSLIGAVGWGVTFALAIKALRGSWTASAIGGAVVVSHWLIDLLVHRPDLTLAGSPPALGLGLWNHPWIEIPLELAFAFGGLWFFVSRTRATGAAGNGRPGRSRSAWRCSRRSTGPRRSPTRSPQHRPRPAGSGCSRTACWRCSAGGWRGPEPQSVRPELVEGPLFLLTSEKYRASTGSARTGSIGWAWRPN